MRTKQDECSVCETQFTIVAAFGMGAREFYCKQCGKAVCERCSMNRKYLSKDSKEKFRVCDFCDTKLDNIRTKVNLERIIQLHDEKILL